MALFRIPRRTVLRSVPAVADHEWVKNRIAPGGVEVIPAATAGWIGGVALLFAALGNLITVLLLPAGAPGRTVGVWLSALTLFVGLFALFAPWNRWGQQSTLVLVPVAFVLIGVGNYTDPLPYVAGVYFVLIGAWTGLCHRRFTTLALTPVFAAVYWVPLAVRPHPDRLESSVFIVTIVSVAIGEVLGTLRIGLENSQRQLAESSRRRFAALTRNSLDVTFVFGADNTIKYVSPAVERRFGYLPEALERVPLSEFLDSSVSGLSEATRGRLLDGSFFEDDSAVTHELQLRHADGSWIDVEVTAQNLVDDPDIAGIVIHVRDIRGRKALEADLQHRAFHDDLTGLANRAAFREEIGRAREAGRSLAVIFLDLDDFKEVNDTLGHEAGDRLLQLVAERLSSSVPGAVTIARLGGDEFGIALEADEAAALKTAQGLITRLSQPYVLADGEVLVGVSAGLALADPADPEELVIGNADIAMYEAKMLESPRVVAFEPQMRERLLHRVELTRRLRLALERGDFVVHYQPSLDTRTRRWVGAEALVRWDDGGEELVLPGRFINVAEETGLIVELGAWILEQACREATHWADGTGAAPWVAVNMSARQFQDPRLLTTVEQALRSSGLPAERLVIEVTESILIGDTETAASRLWELSDMGVRLALDDFGTGYSSLSYLQAFPFDILKIDRSFVRNATTRPRDLALLQTINRLGHNLGLNTLVEGIETQAQADLVTAIGCDLAQGFHLARPMSAASLRATVFPTAANGARRDQDVADSNLSCRPVGR